MAGLFHYAVRLRACLVAGHARSEGLTLVANTVREVECVEALRWANWVEATGR
jgi:predicted nucleic acid-binding protein